MAIRLRSSALRRERLLSALADEAGAPGEGSIAARALHSACEFWTAVNKGTLRHYLGANTAERLRYAAIVYKAMGAVRVANTICEALAELSHTATTTQREYCVGVLQRRLLGSDDPLHELIARLTQRMH